MEEKGDSTPQFNDREAMWKQLRITFENSSKKTEVANYINSLKAIYKNGSVRFASFHIQPHPTFDWYLSRNRMHEMGFFQKFWLMPTVQEFMPEDLSDNLNFYSQDVFKITSSFLLGGQLAYVLANGGAYEKYHHGNADAKRLGDAAAQELVYENYDNVLVFECFTAWSKFFLDVAWDYTWVIVDKDRRVFHVLIATDTD